MLTGTLWIDDLRGRVMTGVAGAEDGIAVRAARTERLTPRPRRDDKEVFGREVKEDSCVADEPLAGRIEDQLGLPKTPWMVWMRWEGKTRAMTEIKR